MGKIIKHETPLPGVWLLEPKVFGDSRGCFQETWNEQDLRDIGLEANFVQDNESTSAAGILRGMHFQKRFPQGKLVRAAWGRIFDAVVDIRRDSPTFGQWFGAELSSDNHLQLWIPPGMAHGFLVLSERAVFCYKVTDHYHPEDEGGIRWNDETIGIRWPQGVVPVLNDRDAHWPDFEQAFNDMKDCRE